MMNNKNDDEENKKRIEELLGFLGKIMNSGMRNTNDDRLLQKVQDLINKEDYDGLKAIPGSHFVETVSENDTVKIIKVIYTIDNSNVRFERTTQYKKSHEVYVKLVQTEIKLETAVKEEDWEKAASLRDEIANIKAANDLNEAELEKVRNQMTSSKKPV